ncbi:unnamed protein product [Closterium sp. NIES-65]|nr:unnamed protein product [Closterium sp. NIES-65]
MVRSGQGIRLGPGGAAVLSSEHPCDRQQSSSGAAIPEHLSQSRSLLTPAPWLPASLASPCHITGQGQGFDLDLVELVSSAVSIPVIASSGAGIPEHFSQVFAHTGASAALAAGIFHRNEVTIESVKTHLAEEGVETRLL